MRRLAFFVLAVAFIFTAAVALAAEADMSQEKILSIATEAFKAKGLQIEDVNIIYDVDGKLWSERLGVAGFEDKTPNHGILKEGFLKNYKIVLFDYKEPLQDVWVFIDKDTGEVLAVYQQ